VKDQRYADAVRLLEPAIKDMEWDSGTWLDLARARIGLRDVAGARKALDGATHAIYVKKGEIDPVRKQLEELEAAQKAKR
jgi:hypothetical protein